MEVWLLHALGRGNMEGVDVLLFVVRLLRDALVALVLLVCVGIFVREGPMGLLQRAIQFVRMIPGVGAVVKLYLKSEIKAFLKQLDLDSEGGKTLSIPEKGRFR